MLIIKKMGRTEYAPCFEAMKAFTTSRGDTTHDELWLLEHDPVYTQGQAGKSWHIIGPTQYPVIQSDRGGQITFHGPGQLMAYCLFDLKRHNLGIRDLVNVLELSVIELLSKNGIQAHTLVGAPGVYVRNKKIASIGLRVKQGKSYHGLCLNIDNDLTPFQSINPCGYSGLEMTTIALECPNLSTEEISDQLAIAIESQLLKLHRPYEDSDDQLPIEETT